VSQGFWSVLERGSGAAASLETLAACAAAVQTELAAFLEARPGADLPRDIEHLRGQTTIIRFAAAGGWRALAERAIDPMSRRLRSIDVLLERPTRGEIIVVELVDLLVDAGKAMRGLADKVAAMRREEPSARVAGLLVVRSTHRNRDLLRELQELVVSRFPARSVDWIHALSDPARPMPVADGFVWVRVDGSVLFAARSSTKRTVGIEASRGRRRTAGGGAARASL
jgi:hypothetical protein